MRFSAEAEPFALPDVRAGLVVRFLAASAAQFCRWFLGPVTLSNDRPRHVECGHVSDLRDSFASI